MQSFRSDLTYALRALAARPGFSALAVLTLAIGIGVNTVTFSAINALLYKPLRFPEAETLGWIQSKRPGNPYAQTSWPDYQDLSRAASAFEGIAAETRMPLGMRDRDGAHQVWALLVSSNYLSIVRARPAIGRVFTADDLAGPEVPAVVSQRFWDRLGGGTSVAGRTLTLNGGTVAIIGVLPDDYQGPGGFFEPDVWLPLDLIEALNIQGRLSRRDRAWLGLVGRLAPGVTAAQGDADLQNVARQLAADYPGTNKDRTLAFLPVVDANPEVRSLAPIAWIVLATVGLVLLIACFNVASLLLARAADRQREISIRSALGAGRVRIVRQLATESLVLAVMSGTVALVVAGWSAQLLSVFSLPSPIPQRLHIPVDRRLIGFTAALVAFGGVLPALLPAFRATRMDVLRSMRVEPMLGGRSSQVRNLLVVAQVAGSTLFLATALLFVQSFWNNARSDPGFETAHALTLELKPADYGYDASRARAFFDDLVVRVRALPGVQQAALADRVPFYVGYPKVMKISSEGADCAVADCRTANVYGVSRDHFLALGVPLKAGRDFTDQEIRSGTSVIVSQSMAARLWPGRSAVGQWIKDAHDGGHLHVIGVAADITHRSFGEPSAEYIYRPLGAAEYADSMTLVVRTAGDPRVLISTVRDQVLALDPTLPPGAAKTMAQRMEMPLWPSRTAAGFFLVCGTLALILASSGLFGVTYLAVSQRTREFGVRAALGATRAAVLRLVLGEGLWLTLPGIAIGLGGTFLVARILARTIFGVASGDPATYAAAALIQSSVALAACLVPANRATKADPILALRHE
jgi:putative ABC transport system permease protein